MEGVELRARYLYDLWTIDNKLWCCVALWCYVAPPHHSGRGCNAHEPAPIFSAVHVTALRAKLRAGRNRHACMVCHQPQPQATKQNAQFHLHLAHMLRGQGRGWGPARMAMDGKQQQQQQTHLPQLPPPRVEGPTPCPLAPAPPGWKVLPPPLHAWSAGRARGRCRGARAAAGRY